MTKLLIILLFASPIIAMEQSGMSEYQKRKLELKERKLHLQELEFLAKNSEHASMNITQETSLFYNTFVAIAISDFFFAKYKNAPEDQKIRTQKTVATIKTKLAQQRNVDIEHVFDPEVQEAAQKQEFFNLMTESHQAAEEYITYKQELQQNGWSAVSDKFNDELFDK